MSSVNLQPGYPTTPGPNAIINSNKSKVFFLFQKNILSKSLDGIKSNLSIIGKVIYEKKIDSKN